MSSPGPTRMPDLCSRRSKYHYVTALNVLIRLGVDLDRIQLLGDGEYQNYRGEIVSQSPRPGTMIDATTPIELRVGFTSAVDMLPYQLFYGLEGITARNDSWEEAARRFMAPFDGSVIRYRSRATNEILKVRKGVVDLSFLVSFLELFNFQLWEREPDLEECLFWAAAMPNFHRWSGNTEKVQSVLQHLFGWEFHIRENVRGRFEIPENLRSRLGQGESRLGSELVLGREFSDNDSTYELIVSEVDPSEVSDLLPDRPKRRKLDWVLKLCMPNNLVCKTRIKVKKTAFRLGQEGHANRLGYSSYSASRTPTRGGF